MTSSSGGERKERKKEKAIVKSDKRGKRKTLCSFAFCLHSACKQCVLVLLQLWQQLNCQPLMHADCEYMPQSRSSRGTTQDIHRGLWAPINRGWSAATSMSWQGSWSPRGSFSGCVYKRAPNASLPPASSEVVDKPRRPWGEMRAKIVGEISGPDVI